MAPFAAQATMFPDWIMLGINLGNKDGVAIYASRDLHAAELRMEQDVHDITTFGSMSRMTIDGLRTYWIEATMSTVFVAYGATYAEAFSKLFAEWDPEAPQRQGLPPKRPMLRHERKMLGG